MVGLNRGTTTRITRMVSKGTTTLEGSEVVWVEEEATTSREVEATTTTTEMKARSIRSTTGMRASNHLGMEEIDMVKAKGATTKATRTPAIRKATMVEEAKMSTKIEEEVITTMAVATVVATAASSRSSQSPRWSQCHRIQRTRRSKRCASRRISSG